MYKNILIVSGIIGLTACATPAERFEDSAKNYGFYGLTLNSGGFEHRVYSNMALSSEARHNSLHVYLDGDGSPWHQERWLNEDPTSRNTLILELMQQDPAPSLLLGRPCYHGLGNATACHHKYWTSHRYSSEVVASMARALKLWLKRHPVQRIVLIGYSGGGTLAVLLAPHIRQTQTVVTLAANLDVAAWSRHHGYNTLPESLNPAALALNPKIRQIHIAGLDDDIVPAGIIKSYADKQTNTTYLAYPGYTHQCCWSRIWRSILEKF